MKKKKERNLRKMKKVRIKRGKRQCLSLKKNNREKESNSYLLSFCLVVAQGWMYGVLFKWDSKSLVMVC